MTMTWFPPSRVKPLRGGPTLSWGILAPGQIADDFAATVLANTDQTIHAVASRSAQRSRRFADRHHIDLAYEGYEHLLADPDVDIVYIWRPRDVVAVNISHRSYSGSMPAALSVAATSGPSAFARSNT